MNRKEDIVQYFKDHGLSDTAEMFGIKEDTVRRYASDFAPKMTDLPKDLLKLAEILSPAEIKAMIKSGRIGNRTYTVPRVNLVGNTFKIAVLSDSHIGSIFTSPYHLQLSQDIVRSEMPDMILHAGDLTEGMSNRPGHIYELSHIGFEAQKEAAIEWMSGFPDSIPIYIIDGNHDRWYMTGGNHGADIVQGVCDATPNMTKIGSDTGFVQIGDNGCEVQLWHGNDGSAYARSYRQQKIVESITGGKKPNLLITGHDHKEIFFTERNIHVIGAGCLQQQTPFMRGKKLAANVGMWIIDLVITNEGRIARFKPEWIPFYS